MPQHENQNHSCQLVKIHSIATNILCYRHARMITLLVQLLCSLLVLSSLPCTQHTCTGMRLCDLVCRRSSTDVVHPLSPRPHSNSGQCQSCHGEGQANSEEAGVGVCLFSSIEDKED